MRQEECLQEPTSDIVVVCVITLIMMLCNVLVAVDVVVRTSMEATWSTKSSDVCRHVCQIGHLKVPG